MRDGTVLAIGGSEGGMRDCTTPVSTSETGDQIDPVKGTVRPFPPLAQPIEGCGGVVTPDGSVFIGGGGQCGVAPLPFVNFVQGAPVPG